MLSNIDVVCQKISLIVRKFFEWIENIAQLNPRDEAAIHRKVGKKHLERGRIEDAIQEFKKAMGLDPNDIGATIDLGAAYHKNKMYDEALFSWGKVIKIDPGNQTVKKKIDECRIFLKKQ